MGLRLEEDADGARMTEPHAIEEVDLASVGERPATDHDVDGSMASTSKAGRAPRADRTR
jgi:hypothetical protein